jgi:Domain of Unknown Function (DUF1080)
LKTTPDECEIWLDYLRRKSRCSSAKRKLFRDLEAFVKIPFSAVALIASQSLHAAPVPLFDGESLAGWQVQGNIAWTVSDRTIIASGSGDGFLVSTEEFGDFHLVAEFWVDTTTNSGIFIRCRDRERIHPETCYELNIWDAHPQQEMRTGAIVMRFMPPLSNVETVGRWNLLEVSAQGPVIEVRVNGATTARLGDAAATAGFIALQHWGEGTVKFRRIEYSAP